MRPRRKTPVNGQTSFIPLHAPVKLTDSGASAVLLLNNITCETVSCYLVARFRCQVRVSDSVADCAPLCQRIGNAMQVGKDHNKNTRE